MESLAAINIRKALAVAHRERVSAREALENMLQALSAPTGPAPSELCALLRLAAAWLVPSASPQQVMESLAAISFILASLVIAGRGDEDAADTKPPAPVSHLVYQRHLPCDAGWKTAARDAVHAAPPASLLHAVLAGCAHEESSIRGNSVQALQWLVAVAPDTLLPAVAACLEPLQTLAAAESTLEQPWWQHETGVLALGACIAGSKLTGGLAHAESAAVVALLPRLIRAADTSYIREACVHVLCILLEPPAALKAEDAATLLQLAAIPCLTDVKPQVRMAAALLLRTYMRGYPRACRDNLSGIVPPLCLLRYYGTERQRYTFQDTWRLLVDASGTPGSEAVLDAATVEAVHAAQAARIAVAGDALGEVARAALLMSSSGSAVSDDHRADTAGSLPRVSGPEPSLQLDGAAAASSARAASPMRMHSIAASMTEALTSQARDEGVVPSNTSIGPALAEAYFDGVLDTYMQQLQQAQPLAREAGALCIAEMSVKFNALLVAAAAERVIPALQAQLRIDHAGGDEWSAVDACVIALQCMLTRCSSLLSADSIATSVACLLNMLTYPHKAVRDHAAAAVRQVHPIAPYVVGDLKARASDAFRAFLRRDRSLPLDATSTVSSSAPAVQVDGAMYALRELSSISARDAEALLPVAAEAMGDATRMPSLQENMCRVLLEVMTRLGKAALKRNLELFLAALVDMLGESREAAARTRAFAAGDCIAYFQSTLGPSIFAARLNADQAAMLARSDCMPRSRGSGGTGVGSVGTARAASPSPLGRGSLTGT